MVNGKDIMRLKLWFLPLALLLCTCAWYLSPLLKPLPQPVGPYPLGTTAITMVDDTRKELYANQDQQRTLMARLWYPASKSDAPLYPYLGDAMPAFQQLVAQFYHVPLWISKLLLRDVMTHAHADIPCALTTHGWPVVLFSHGLLGMPSETYVSILEAIASSGYVVVGIEHPYLNVFTRYPDGSVVSSQRLSQKFSAMRPQQQKEFQCAAIDTYKADMNCVLEHLELLNNDPASTWYQKLDLSRVVVMGHSAGGTAAIEFCRAHQECKGAIDLDGWFDQCIGNEPIDQPLLLIVGSPIETIDEPTPEYLARKELTREQYYAQEAAIVRHKKMLFSQSGCSIVVLPGLAHDEFGDLILRKWPLRSWHAPDAYATLKTINTAILDFLKHNL